MTPWLYRVVIRKELPDFLERGWKILGRSPAIDGREMLLVKRKLARAELLKNHLAEDHLKTSRK